MMNIINMPKNPSQSQRAPTMASKQSEHEKGKKADSNNFVCLKCLRNIEPPILQHVACKGMFCQTHWTQFMQGSSAAFNCPKCAVKLTAEQLRQVDVRMHGHAPCGLLIGVGQFEEHKKTCEKCQTYKSRKIEEKQQKVEIQADSNQEVYACPFCSEQPMRRHLLLEHMRSHANMAGACPVCAAPSGGEKHYFSKNLYGHLMLRHKTDTPQLPVTLLKDQIAHEFESTQKADFVKEEAYPQKVAAAVGPKESKKSQKHESGKLSVGKVVHDSKARKPALKNAGFSLKSNLSERHLIAAKPIQIQLDHALEEEPTQMQQGLVGLFTFGVEKTSSELLMLDYYWAKDHYVGCQSIAPYEDPETDVDIKICKDLNKPPDYLKNVANICFPDGIPSSIHINLAADSAQENQVQAQLESFHKVVFYGTKKFSGQLNYLSILSCA